MMVVMDRVDRAVHSSPCTVVLVDGHDGQSSPYESVYGGVCCIQMTVVMDRVDRAVHASPCTVVLTAENCTCTNVR